MKFPVSECKYCGGSLFYREQLIKERGILVFKSDGSFGDNSQLHEGLFYKDLKRYYCVDCHHYLFSEKDIKESDIS